MYIKRFILLFISHVPTLIWAQASYMHEISEDALIDKGNDSISTFLDSGTSDSIHLVAKPL